VIADQVLDGQRLDAKHLVLAHQPRRQLVQASKTLIRDARGFPRHLQTRLFPILGPLLCAGEVTLRVRQAARTAAQMLRIGDLLATTEHRHVFQANFKPTSTPLIALTTGRAWISSSTKKETKKETKERPAVSWELVMVEGLPVTARDQ